MTMNREINIFFLTDRQPDKRILFTRRLLMIRNFTDFAALFILLTGALLLPTFIIPLAKLYADLQGAF